MNSKLVIFILIIYGILIFKTVYDFYNSVLATGIVGDEELVNLLLIGLNLVLTFYGSFIGVVIGFSSLTSEKNNNALNILLVKPLFRDTIITGKLVGAFGFLVCVFGLTIALYTSALLIIAGSSIAPVIIAYILKLPLQFIISMIYVLIFLTLSMLLSLLIEEPAFALISGVLLIFVSDVITLVSVAGFISYIVSPDNPGMVLDLIVGLSPSGILDYIIHFLYPINIKMSVPIGIEMMKLALYLIIAMILNYIVFVRRDVA
jgi:ABC-2 type transport system permease protein